MMLLQLFLSFLQIGMFSVGGGYAAIPLIQNQTVDVHAWLSATEFMDLATIAEMTPGPIAVNAATFVGLKTAGLPGAIAATFGCIFPSLILVSILAYIYRRYRELPLLQSILSALRPAVVSLILAAGLNMFLQVVFGGRNALSLPHAQWACLVLFVAAFVALRKAKASPILTMLLCGAAGLLCGMLGLM
ncbi:MAG: chromate transporter [Clostridia bacterium]|nr:chromate transporter [Clostridia bacterium]